MLSEQLDNLVPQHALAHAARAFEHDGNVTLFSGMLPKPRQPTHEIAKQRFILRTDVVADVSAHQRPVAGPGRDGEALPQIEDTGRSCTAWQTCDAPEVLPALRMLQPQ